MTASSVRNLTFQFADRDRMVSETKPPIAQLEPGVSSLTVAGLATVTLLAAVLVYSVCRSSAPSGWPRPVGSACGIGRFGDVLPSFAHSYAFAIWLALALGKRAEGVLLLLVAWALVETTLEIAQLGSVQLAPGLAADPALALLADASRLLSSGTFDIRDIAAIWAGVFAATMTLGIHSAIYSAIMRGSMRCLRIGLRGTEKRPPATPQ